MYTYSSRLHVFLAAMLEKDDNDLGGSTMTLSSHKYFQHAPYLVHRLAIGLYKSHGGVPRCSLAKRIIQRKADNMHLVNHQITQKKQSKINLSGVCFSELPHFCIGKDRISFCFEWSKAITDDGMMR